MVSIKVGADGDAVEAGRAEWRSARVIIRSFQAGARRITQTVMEKLSMHWLISLVGILRLRICLRFALANATFRMTGQDFV